MHDSIVSCEQTTHWRPKTQCQWYKKRNQFHFFSRFITVVCHTPVVIVFNVFQAFFINRTSPYIHQFPSVEGVWGGGAAECGADVDCATTVLFHVEYVSLPLIGLCLQQSLRSCNRLIMSHQWLLIIGKIHVLLPL